MILNCYMCKADVKAKKKAEYKDNWLIDRGYERGECGIPIKVTLLQCALCKGPFLIIQHFWNEDIPNDPEILYPPAKQKRNLNIPDSIKRSYNEAISSLETKNYLSTVVMCRRTLEGIVKHFYPSIKNLSIGIQNLRNDKIIDGSLFEWANELRENGNLAAHHTDVSISYSDASDLLNFTEEILFYIFVLRKQYEKFMERQSIKDMSREIKKPDSKKIKTKLEIIE